MSDYLSLSSADPSRAGRPPFQLGSLLSTTLSVLAANFVPFVLLVTILLSPVIAITVNAGRIALSTEPFSGWELLALFLTLVLTQIASAALIYGVFQQLRGTPASIGQCLAMGLRKTPVAILAGLLYSIIVALGSLLCLVPGIYLGVVYAVTVPAAVLEGNGVLAAMQRSKRLTIGHGWTILAAYLLLVFSLGFVNMGGMLLLMSYPRASGAWNSGMSVLQSTVQATLIAVTYYQLRASEEDLDLAAIAKVFD